jgi:UDP:flavonoid glycosyltransferase YjiC (YdhE family)
VRITLIAVGSRGDVQPYVALGIGLREAGHEVRLATHPRFEALVRGRGLELAPLAEGSVSRGLRPGTRANGAGDQPGASLPWWLELLEDGRSVARRRLADCRDACAGAEAIVVSVLGTLLGYHLAEQLRVPLVRAYVAPFGAALATATLPGSGLGWIGPKLSVAGSGLARQALWQYGRPWVNAARRDVLGLPPLPLREVYGTLDARRTPLLYGYSPAVAPSAEARAWVHVTGYWFLDRAADWEPPAPLVEFLAAGPPPVFVGFGGRLDRSGETATVVVEALSRAGLRGILQSERPAGVSLPPDVFAIGAVPHDWLLPRMAAAVHHGGAGTTAAALRAGLPSVVVPDYADQPFWARRIHELGAGPRPVPRKRLSADRLAQAVGAAATDAAMRERATALGRRIEAEQGVARAVEVLERQLAHRRAPGPDPAALMPAR